MNAPASSRFRTYGLAAAGLVVAAVLVLKAAQAHGLNQERSLRKADVEAGPRVHTYVVGAEGGGAPLVFQGEALPRVSTTLYAKLGGFIKEIRVDKGSRVRKGDVLAIVESPETDRAAQALRSTYENLQRVSDRLEELGRQGVANAQDQDNARAAAKVAKENWLAQTVLQGYEQVTAPFAGVVTARLVDPGAFVQNASGSLSSQPIVSLADLGRLRVTFFLDQSTAALAKVGQEVAVSPAERPDQVIRGRLDRVAGTLDLRTRTMLAEADVDNADGRFLGGGFVRVALRIPGSAQRLAVPSDTLLVRGDSAFAATVAAGHVHLQPLVLGGDAGSRVRVLQGLAEGARIIRNPSPGLREGDAVQVVD